MGTVYLSELEQVFRGDNPNGYNIWTLPAWQTRGYSAGGYTDVRGFVMHHTAEGLSSDGWPSANFQTFQDGDKPNVGLYLSRHPKASNGGLFICAAGGCNTQGKGGPLAGPRGGVTLNAGNFLMAALEIGNNGTGEPYNDEQQEAILWVTSRWFRWIGGPRFGLNPSQHLWSHFEYAPTRKIDPSGPCRWAPNGGKWNMNAFRGDVVKALGPQEDDVTPAECEAAVAKVIDAKMPAIVNAVWAKLIPNPISTPVDQPTAASSFLRGIIGETRAAKTAAEDAATTAALTAVETKMLAAIAAIDAGGGATPAEVETAIRAVFADAGTP